jgi:HEAT repeat protein
MAELEDLLQQCTVQIAIPGQSGWGTGFFVASGLILTCAHVVKSLDFAATARIRWQQQKDFAAAELVQLVPKLDLALLQFTPTDTDLPCVYLDEGLQAGHELYFFGYPDQDFDNGCPVTGSCEGFTGDLPPLIKFKQAQVRPGMSGSALLNRDTGKVCGIVKFTRDRSFDLGGGAIPTRVILEQFPQLGKLQQQFHQRDRRWSELLPTAMHPGKTLDAKTVQPYLRSLIADEKYQGQSGFYTPTDAIGKLQEQKATNVLDIGLMVQLMQPKQSEDASNPEQKEPEKTERLPVLEGIRKYAAEHVLLMGRPGSGKSTALLRLLVDEARKALADPSVKIPVLVELRYLDAERPSMLERIGAFLRSHNLDLEEATLRTALAKGRLLLLIDGVNELASEAARRAVARFRQDYPRTPMIFTTRNVAIGGDVGIEKKLEMQPLTEQQMRQFVQMYLPEQGEPMLRQLQGRLREVGQTPLLLWMLCEVFKRLKQLPSSLGLLFRWFAGEYDKLKQDAPISEGLRHWQPELLQHLAFTMMQAEQPTELRVAIPRQEAATVLAEYLHGKVDYPMQRAKEWLEDLLEHNLLQHTSQNQLGFHHQLLQEYYAAEALLQRLPQLSDEQLQRDYLNYLKWTEPIALMLALVEQEAQALRVVRLALEIDMMLGARLAGEVKPKFQSRTMDYIIELKVPQLIEIEFLSRTYSDYAIPALLKALENQDYQVRWSAVDALGKFGSEAAIPALLKALENDDPGVPWRAVRALGMLNNEVAIPALLKALEHQDNLVGSSAVEALGKLGSEAATSALCKALEHRDSYIRQEAARALAELRWQQLHSKAAVSELPIEHQNPTVRNSMIRASGKLSSKADSKLLNELQDSDSLVRLRAAEALSKLGGETVVLALPKALKHQDFSSRGIMIEALCKWDREAAIPELLKALEHQRSIVRSRVAEALGILKCEVAIPELLKVLEDQDPSVRESAAKALGKLGSETAIPGLLKALEDQDSCVRLNVAEALGRLGSKAAVPELLKALKDRNYEVRRTAAFVLGNLGNEAAIPVLIEALVNQDSYYAAEVLGNLGSEAVIPSLLNIIERYQDYEVRECAAKVLVKLGKPHSLTRLWQMLLANTTKDTITVRPIIIPTIAAIQNRCKFYNYEIAQGLIPQGKSISLFFSYAAKDEDLRNELAKHLNLLERQGAIASWDNSHILPGDEREQVISDRLNTADIILLLISPDSMADNNCYDVEIKRAMERHQAGEARVIPILLRPVDWTGASFSQIPVFPRNRQPVTTWDNRDEAFRAIAEGIREVAIELRRTKAERC